MKEDCMATDGIPQPSEDTMPGGPVMGKAPTPTNGSIVRTTNLEDINDSASWSHFLFFLQYYTTQHLYSIYNKQLTIIGYTTSNNTWYLHGGENKVSYEIFFRVGCIKLD